MKQQNCPTNNKIIYKNYRRTKARFEILLVPTSFRKRSTTNGFGLGISVVESAIAQHWSRLGATGVQDITQASQRRVTVHEIVAFRPAADPLIVFGQIVNHGYHVPVRNNVEGVLVQVFDRHWRQHGVTGNHGVGTR